MANVSTQRIVPFLWFDAQAEEALNLYVSLFPNSEITSMKKWGQGTPFPPETVMNGSAVIDGLRIYAMDAGPMFKFNESVSFMVTCKDQAEIDRYWDALIADGGSESMCGWLKDKFGLSWQIVPEMLSTRMASGDPQSNGKMMAALSGMRKLIIADLEAAYNS